MPVHHSSLQTVDKAAGWGAFRVGFGSRWARKIDNLSLWFLAPTTGSDRVALQGLNHQNHHQWTVWADSSRWKHHRSFLSDYEQTLVYHWRPWVCWQKTGLASKIPLSSSSHFLSTNLESDCLLCLLKWAKTRPNERILPEQHQRCP